MSRVNCSPESFRFAAIDCLYHISGIAQRFTLGYESLARALSSFLTGPTLWKKPEKFQVSFLVALAPFDSFLDTYGKHIRAVSVYTASHTTSCDHKAMEIVRSGENSQATTAIHCHPMGHFMSTRGGVKGGNHLD